MKKVFFILFLVIIFTVPFYAQMLVNPGYYLIFFKDKSGCRYDVTQADSFLTQRAIERRERFNIPITTQDLPVSTVYVDSLRGLGYNILLTSKWLNAALIHCEDSSKLKALASFSFIDTLGITRYRYPKDTSHPMGYNVKITQPGLLLPKIKEVYDYGAAGVQNKLLNVNVLHSLGYTGQGVVMALLDAGFLKVDSLSAFDSAWAKNHILGWYDFVDRDSNVFDVGNHGMMSLSTILANTKKMVGSAPDVSVYLFRTEDEASEYPIEEFFWLVAAERADSLGVDIISTSLGYETFDDSTMNYSYKVLNGNYAISTIAADIASSKGMIVVVSAGNSGNDQWHYISTPADADSVIAVAATDYNGEPVDFSAYGPSVDGRVKPDVGAVGYFVIVWDTNDRPTIAFGTSFSAPTVAGAVACLWQAHPDKSNMEIVRALQMSANKATHPDNRIGYGIPNMFLAHLILQKYDLRNFDKERDSVVIP